MDYSETRFSKLRQLDTANVKRLGLVWSYDLESTRGVESTPVVVDGIMYVTASWSVVHAVDVRTGKRLWSYDPGVDRANGFKGCCDVVNRGVAVYKGKVYVGAFDGRLVALDAATGQKVWEQDTIIDRAYSYTITGAPRVIKGKVLIGNGGAEYGVRGYVTAYDAETGAQQWRWLPCPAIHPSPSRTRPWPAPPRPGTRPASGGRPVAAARPGTPWPMTPSSTSCTSARATARPGRKPSAARPVATTCTWPASWR
jgi:quinohemoprotein ethanol dehydrogenase